MSAGAGDGGATPSTINNASKANGADDATDTVPAFAFDTPMRAKGLSKERFNFLFLIRKE